MRFLFYFICVLCVNFVVGEKAYRAAFVNTNDGFSSYASVIRDAAYKHADILILPPLKGFKNVSELSDLDEYDEIIRSISSSAKRAGLYVVAHLSERARCQNSDEIIRSSVVFDRQGAIAAVYRKPVNEKANCTASGHMPTFKTDFGVTFGLLMEEDLVIKHPEELRAKNLIVSGGLKTDIPFLRGPQLTSSWSYVTDANLITPCGVYAGRAGLKTSSGDLVVVKFNSHRHRDGPALVTPATITSSPSEDLSQYIIRPLDMEASIQGYSQNVCHGRFCCEFYIKTSYVGSSKQEASYGLAAFDGVRHFTNGRHIGIQSCSVVACAGLYKRSCGLGPNNSTNTLFENIQISGNFTKKNSAHFPVVSSTSEQNVKFEETIFEKTTRVTIKLSKGRDVLNFGIFGRVYDKDFDLPVFNENVSGEDNYYDYIFNEDVHDFFDYLWIRVRILIFIVSIYVLEMM